ncbi:uncharacterized protein HKW66_Vig0077780 [Vigna angularis]|uniref:Uncharacterized protein n=1 Tax=Phaseolus angularis TaxID=3914 RepID=A0A8T0K550_PHAAN|nr:uncharacterized protein HKW66_Vig0077780 [Vigna angularis]
MEVEVCDAGQMEEMLGRSAGKLESAMEARAWQNIATKKINVGNFFRDNGVSTSSRRVSSDSGAVFSRREDLVLHRFSDNRALDGIHTVFRDLNGVFFRCPMILGMVVEEKKFQEAILVGLIACMCEKTEGSEYGFGYGGRKSSGYREEQQQDNGYGYGGRSEYDEKPSYGSQGGVENGYGHPPQEEGYRNHCYEKHDDDDDDEGYGHKKYVILLRHAFLQLMRFM